LVEDAHAPVALEAREGLFLGDGGEAPLAGAEPAAYIGLLALVVRHRWIVREHVHVAGAEEPDVADALVADVAPEVRARGVLAIAVVTLRVARQRPAQRPARHHLLLPVGIVRVLRVADVRRRAREAPVQLRERALDRLPAVVPGR